MTFRNITIIHTRQPYIHLLAIVLSLSLALQHCGQPNEGFGHMEASSGRERPIETPESVLSTCYGPFTTASGALVTLQQAEGRWHARVVEEAGTVVDEQQLDVGCAEDITKTLSQLEHQPADYIKSRLHVLTPAQSPTGKHAIYLGRVGLRGGMAPGGHEDDTSTSIQQAANQGDLRRVKYLVEEARADVNARDGNGKTALERAAGGGHLEVVKYFVEEKEVDVNARDRSGATTLHWAAEKGHLNVVRYLEGRGADMNARDGSGTTALRWAAGGGHLNVVRYFVEEKEADVNARNRNGKTALHLAAHKGHLDVVRYFVEEKEADVNAGDDKGVTALYRAAAKGHLAVVKYLGGKGADMNAWTRSGATALHEAAGRGQLAVVKYLGGKGADVNARDDKGVTALHWAAHKGRMETILYLIEEAGLYNHFLTIDTPRHRSFAQWENVSLYFSYITLADALFREEGCQRLRREAIERITDASRKLKLVRKAQAESPREECPHDMGTAFANRFKNRMRREGVPKGMLLDPQGYFEGIRLPESLKTELQTFVELLNKGRKGFVMQISSLVALLASTEEESQEISPTPLSWMICPRAGFSAYNPENPIQKQTVTFYTQRSPELAALLLDGENVKSEIDPVEMERALCKYLVTHLLKLEFDDESIKAVVKDGERKGLVVEQINAMLTMPNVVFPTGLKGKLKQTVKMLLTPNVATAVEQLQAAMQSMAPHLSTPGSQDAYQNIGNALSSLNAFETLPKRSLPSQSGMVEQRKGRKRKKN